jgi:putative hemolysin
VFELANRAYFAASISDRGDEFYDQFTDRHSALLAEQEAGICAFYVLVAGDGSVLGRFNLVGFEDGTAELGYRVAQPVAGRGVANATVRELCRPGGGAARAAHAQGGHRQRECRVPEGTHQGRVRPGSPGQPGRPRR